MDVFTLVRACGRRWYVFLPLIILTAVAALLQAQSVKPVYGEARHLLVVAPAGRSVSTKPTTSIVVNPLGSSDTALAALVQRLNSADVSVLIPVKTASAGYVATSTQGNVALLSLQSKGGSAAEATEILTVLQAQATRQLAYVQARVGAPRSQFFRLVLLSSDGAPAATYPSRTKSTVIVALAGFLASVLIAELVDVLMLRRRERRRERRRTRDLDQSREPARARSAPSDSDVGALEQFDQDDALNLLDDDLPGRLDQSDVPERLEREGVRASRHPDSPSSA